jgi:hypothetical protein
MTRPSFPPSTTSPCGRLVLGLALVLLPTLASAGEDPKTLAARLGERARAKAALEALVAAGAAAVPAVEAAITRPVNVEARGWAIVALSRIPGPEADAALARVSALRVSSELEGTWLAAARIARAMDLETLATEAGRAGPALQRPVSERLKQLLADPKFEADAGALLELSARAPSFAGSLGRLILERPLDELIAVLRRPSDALRQQAAGYLATRANRNPKEAEAIARSIVKLYAFDAKAKEEPWKGGALFVPALRWTAADAKTLVGHLLAWHLWADQRKDVNLQRQLHNNMRSLELARVAGYASPGWQDVGTAAWLTIWAKAYGADETIAILRAQGLDKDARYRGAVDAK